jgi:hypothetical protein
LKGFFFGKGDEYPKRQAEPAVSSIFKKSKQKLFGSIEVEKGNISTEDGKSINGNNDI